MDHQVIPSKDLQTNKNDNNKDQFSKQFEEESPIRMMDLEEEELQNQDKGSTHLIADIDNDQDMEQSQEIEEIEQQTQRMINQLANLGNQQDDQQDHQVIQNVKNPVSAYLVFVKSWKTGNPQKKMNLAEMGALYKNLTEQQKKPYLQDYKNQKAIYDNFRLRLQIDNPQKVDRQLGSVSVFPLHRVKCIMRQDSFYSSKVEAVAATAKATQFFGQYLLQEVKKVTEGKGKVTAQDLYECIAAKSKVLGFLECLIDERGNEGQMDVKGIKERGSIQEKGKKELTPKVRLEIENHQLHKKGISQKGVSGNQRIKIPSNQTLLTDIFKSSGRQK